MRSGVLLLAAGEAVTRLLGFLLSAVIARRFGLEALAALTVAQGLTAFALVAGDGGMSTDGVRRLAAGEAHRARLIALTTAGQVCLSLAATAVLLVVVAAIPISSLSKQAVLVLSLLPLAYALNLGYVLQSSSRFLSLSLSRMLGAATGTAVGLICLYLYDSFLLAVASLVLGAAVADVLVAVISRGDWSRPGPLNLRAVLGRIKQGRAFLGYTLAHQASSTAPLLLTAVVGTAAALGQYSVAHRVFLLAVAPAILLSSVLLPKLSRTDGLLESGMWPPVGAVVVAAAGASSALLVFAGPLAAALFGAAAGAAAPAVQLLGFLIPLTYTSLMLTTALLAQGRARVQASVSVISLVSVVLLSSALVRHLGAPGPVYAIVASELLVVCLLARALRLGARRVLALAGTVIVVLASVAVAVHLARSLEVPPVVEGVVWSVAASGSVAAGVKMLGGTSLVRFLLPRVQG